MPIDIGLSSFQIDGVKMKIAIVGAGIVGSTAAYYLSKEKDVEVTVFDHGLGQATKAAAGIISPWFSKRRNKAWYRMARLGADFYQDLVSDLENDGYDTSFYDQSGVALLKKDDSKLDGLYQHAETRLEESPIIGELSIKMLPTSRNLLDLTVIFMLLEELEWRGQN